MILEFTYNVHLRSITITDTLKEILDRNQNCTTRYTIIIFLVCDTWTEHEQFICVFLSYEEWCSLQSIRSRKVSSIYGGKKPQKKR